MSRLGLIHLLQFRAAQISLAVLEQAEYETVLSPIHVLFQTLYNPTPTLRKEDQSNVKGTFCYDMPPISVSPSLPATDPSSGFFSSSCTPFVTCESCAEVACEAQQDEVSTGKGERKTILQCKRNTIYI
ncbi:hypothetical protein KCU88_g436, partial [Aureobasidium melanogenum]